MEIFLFGKELWVYVDRSLDSKGEVEPKKTTSNDDVQKKWNEDFVYYDDNQPYL